MARKSMSALDLMAWVAASGRRLEGLRVDNIYPAQDGVALRIRAHYGDTLIIQPAVRAHLSSRFQTPPEAQLPPLVRALRDNVRDERVRSVSQAGFDRLLEITFYNGYRLVAELMPRGVLALLSPEGRVVAASDYPTMRDRSIRRGQPYSYPPLRSENPMELSGDQLAARLRSSRSPDVVRALVVSLGVPGEAAEEAVYRAGLSPSAKPEAIGAGDAAALASSLQGILKESLAGRGYVAIVNGVPGQATPFEPRSLAGRAEVKAYELIDEALDDYFAALQKSSEPRRSDEEAKVLRSLEEAETQAKQYLAEAQELEAQAQALGSNYELAVRALECAKTGDNCEGLQVDVDRRSGTATMNLGGVRVKVYLYETIDDAIKRLYREAGELRAKARRADAVRAQLVERLEEVRRSTALAELRARARSRRRAWYERYHWLVTTGGLLAIGGRDADQNESLVRRMLEDSDVFLHADIHGASAVVLLARGREFSSDDVSDASVLAAAYSKAWKAGAGSVEVYWVMGSQVSKSPPAGEYLTKGSFMIYGKKNYLPPVKLELALGVALDEEGLPVVVVGPERLVAPQALAYVILVPGDRGVEEVAERAVELMARAAGDRGDLVRALDAEQVAREVPGRSSILATRRGQGGGLRRPIGALGM